MTYCITRNNWNKLKFSVRTFLTASLVLWVAVLVAQSPCPSDSIPKVTPSVTAPFCPDSASGGIVLTVKPDSFTYKFKWSGVSNFIDSSQNINNIKSGDYYVTVTNTRNMCDTTLQIAVPIGRDTKLPRVKCKNTSVYLNDNGVAVLKPQDIDNGTADNCAPPQLFLSKTNFACENEGVNSVWLIAIDGSGNKDSCEAIVIIKDTILPQLTCKNATIFLNNTGKASLKITDILVAAVDNCIFTLDISQKDFSCTHVGQNSVTILATDLSNNISKCTASILVRDTIKPDIACKNTTIYLNNSGEKALSVDSVKSNASDNCAIDTVFLSKINFTCLNIGSNEVTLTARDKSGNINTCKANIFVRDTIPPSLTCPSNIVKTLASGECTTIVDFAPKVTDNCTATIAQIAGFSSGTAFSIGDTKVSFRATDIAGNTTNCSFNVSIKEYPATGSISCTGQIVVSLNNSCAQFIDFKTLLLGQNYGCFNRYSLELYDQSLKLPDNYIRSGQIGRNISYKIIDSRTLNSCRGNIVVTDNMPPIIKKPLDLALNCYQVAAVENPLPNITGTPEVISDCSNLPTTTTYADESFQTFCNTSYTAAPAGFPSDIVFNAFLARNCSRIIVRTFYVTDYYGNTSTCKQAIYIRNSDILFDVQFPVSYNITCTGLPVNVLPDSALINGIWVAGTGRPQLANGKPISPNNLGTTQSACRFYATYSDFKWNSIDGAYYIDRTWTVTNECTGENRTWLQTIGVEDGLPSVSCRVGHKVNLTSNKTVTVKASDLILSTFDKCTPFERMQIGIRRAGQGAGFPDSTILTFNCNNIGTQQLEIWIKDETGYTATCTTAIQIEDAGNYCVPPPLSISGKIVREDGVSLTANAHLYNLKDIKSQVANSTFNFENLKQEQNYRLEAERPKDWINGVTTFDIVLISKHILGYEYLNSPYKRIAADINRDGEINAADMLMVRRLILRQLDSIPGSRPWCFIPKNLVFNDPNNPTLTPIVENYTFNILKDSIKNADFIGIKMGDLNLNARTSALQSANLTARNAPFIFKTDNIYLNKNEKRTIVLTPSVEKPISAFQCTFNFDAAVVIEKIEAEGLANFTTANYHFIKNNVAISWNGSMTNPTPTVQLKITLTTQKPLFLNKILSITSDLALSEAYTDMGEALPIDLHFNTFSTAIIEKSSEKDYALHQNAPNPFSDETVVTFDLPQASTVGFDIYDLNGRILKTESRECQAGKNHIKINKNDIPTEGVYFYALTSRFGILMRRMIVIQTQ